jgi:hypothetical protein
MEFLGLAITLLAGVLTYLAWRNGQWMKQAHQDTIEVLLRIEKGQEEVGKEAAEARKEAAEARKEMAEAIRHLADLIVAEGERTRQAIPSR